MQIIKKIIFLSLIILPLLGMNLINTEVKAEEGPQTVTLKGKIIGLTCYLKHNAIGPKHKTCARTCAESGLPLGLLGDDGKLYQIMGNGHESLKTANAKLLEFIEEKIQATGKTFKKNGYYAVVIEKIKKQ